MIELNDVVQFTENHKWCGCLGIVMEVKDLKDKKKYRIGVPCPQAGIAFMIDDGSNIEYVGHAVLGIRRGEE